MSFQNMKGESELRRQALDALHAEVEELCRHCSPEEAEALREQFKQICSNYDNANHLMDQRVELCQNWGQFQAAQKQGHKRMKRILKAMESPDIKQEDLAKLSAELSDIQKSLGAWNQDSAELDRLMSESQTVIKDRGSMKTLHFKGEVQSDNVEFEKAQRKMGQKEGHLIQTTNLRSDFCEGRDKLLKWMRQMNHNVQSAKTNESSLDGLKDLKEQLEVK